jgi:hypothetical protein
LFCKITLRISAIEVIINAMSKYSRSAKVFLLFFTSRPNYTFADLESSTTK